MYRVLVPVDDESDQARSQADYVTSLPCATEEIAVVVGHPLAEESSPVEGAEHSEPVDHVATALEAAGIEYELRKLSYSPPDRIIEFARTEDVDEIVMAGRRRSPVMKAILGDITQAVILNTDIPITVTGTR